MSLRARDQKETKPGKASVDEPGSHSAAAVARSSLVESIRPETAAPASGLSWAKMNTDRLETIATRTKASERSRAMSSESPKPNWIASTQIAATATPIAPDICCETLAKLVARLICG